MLTCANCGEQSPERTRFCLNCGASLAAAALLDATTAQPGGATAP
jgi:uncharacterized membrane protein YvbJ